jgi:hypothetical protein
MALISTGHSSATPWPINKASRPSLTDAPNIGRDAMVPPVRPELESAELLLEMAQIPVVTTQESQNGKSFTIDSVTYDRFQH